MQLILILSTALALELIPTAARAQSCDCDITVAPGTTLIDGNVIPHAPGDVICLMAGVKQSLRIFNFQGSANNYLVFKNCGGQLVLSNSTGNYGISVQNSKYFRLTGTGDSNFLYGIKVSQSGSMGVTLGTYSTDYELDHLELANTGFAGIMSKTEPDCNVRDLRSFVQRNTYFHDNYIHHTGGEGFYVGYTAYPSGTKQCGGQTVTVYPHRLEGVAIYRNLLENTGWDGIQLGSTTADGAIYENIVENFGTANQFGQSNGLQLSAGVVADVYDNWLSTGPGNGMAVFGAGGNLIYNNVILDAGASGIFCDDRYTTPGEGFHFINNTFVRPAVNGMRMYSDESTGNVFYNNIVADPGQACVHLLHTNIDWSESNNLCAATVAEVGFVAPLSGNYHLDPDSPACGAGRDVSMYGITHDHDGLSRAAPHDIGAFECSSASGKLTLTPAMVVQESGAGSAGMLVDEQALAGNPRDGAAGQPTSAWISGTHSQMPANAYIDLGREVDLTDIYLFDTNGNDVARNDEWVVSVGTPGNWTVVATESCGNYLTWKRHTVAVRTRYVRLTNRVAYIRMSEVVLYGSAANP